MPRTALTPVSLTNLYAGTVAANAADATFTAADVGNGNSVPLTGNEMVIVNNTGASPYTVTFTSVANRLGRTGDIGPYTMAAGVISIFGPFLPEAFRQSDGNLYLSASNASMKFCVVKTKGVLST